MLGSLARKLRALGFDAEYYKGGNDSVLTGIAAEEDRIILTSDRELAGRSRPSGTWAILLKGSDDRQRVRALGQAFRDSGLSLARGEPLCSLCGGELETLTRKEVAGKVPPSVQRRHRSFYRCLSCGKYYWRGSHWKKLRSLARRLETK